MNLKTSVIKLHCSISRRFLVEVKCSVLTLKTKYCTKTPNASTPLLACSSSAICFCLSNVCWSTSCWSICCCVLLAFDELFLLTILLLLLFSNSLTLVFDETLSVSRMMVPFRLELFGGGVAGFDEWVERIDDRGLPFWTDACPARRLCSVKIAKKITVSSSVKRSLQLRNFVLQSSQSTWSKHWLSPRRGKFHSLSSSRRVQ